MRIAVAQLDTSGQVPGDAARRLLEAAGVAARGGARLVVCPYASLSHPFSPDVSDQADYALELTDAIAFMTREAPCPLLVCGGIDMNGFSGNLALFIHDGMAEPIAVGKRSKGILGAAPVFELDGMRFAVACTYDDLDALAESDEELDAVVFASAHGFAATDALSAMAAGYSEGYLRDLVMDLDTWLIGAASLGGYGEDVFCGASFVCAPWGELAAHGPAFEEYLLTCDIDPESEGPLEAPAEPVYFDRALMMWLALSLGLTDLLRSQGTDDVVVALDGSLTSSLCCVLASDALGPTHVHALLPATLDGEGAARAQTLADTLGVTCHAPTSKFARLAKDEATMDYVTQLELARLADSLGALPLVALDKTGLALEAGDVLVRGGWLAPLGDVYRLDLSELARFRNTISPVVPRESMRELRVPDIEGITDVAKTDRGRLEFVDMVLMSRIEGNRTPSELSHTFGNAQVVDGIVRRMSDTAPARRGFAVLRVSPRALADTVQPLGLSWRNRTHDEDIAARVDAIMARVNSGAASDDEDQVRDVIGLLNDFVGGIPASTPRPNPLGWGIPFSEN